MANETTLRSRLIQKHDIEANWKIAGEAEKPFVPKQAEVIVYDDRYTDNEGNVHIVADKVRFKIGDGVTNVNDLPFASIDKLDWVDIQNKPENLVLTDSASIIDVDVLPTETADIWFKFSQDSVDMNLVDYMNAESENYRYILVDELPTSFEITTLNVGCYIYILRKTGVPYISVDGTTPLLFLDVWFEGKGGHEGNYKGIVASASEITEDGVYTIIGGIDENAFYRVPQKDYTNIECWIKLGNGGQTAFTLEQIISDTGAVPAVNYSVVMQKPASPVVSNFATFNPVEVYIINDIPSIYGDGGDGNMWITVAEMMSISGYNISSAGRTFDIEAETKAGVYVSYDTTYSLESAYTIFNNQKGEMYDATTQVIVVNSLPTEGTPYIGDFILTFYILSSDRTIYVYYEDKWRLYEELAGTAYGGVISNESEAVDPEKFYIVCNEGGYQYYRYENGWVKVSPILAALKNQNGDLIIPQTTAEAVLMNDGSNLADKLTNVVFSGDGEVTDAVLPEGGSGLAIKAISFTDRPSAWEWVKSNHSKVFRMKLENSSSLLWLLDTIGTVGAGSSIDAVIATSVAPFQIAADSITYINLYAEITNQTSVIGTSTVSLKSSGTSFSDSGTSEIPDELWSSSSTKLTVYYTDL